MSLYEAFQNVISSLGMTELAHPIFDHAPICIRFQIGENGAEVYRKQSGRGFSVNPDYVKACLNRSIRIYDSLRTPPDILVIEGYLYEDDTTEAFVSSVRSATDLPQPDEMKCEICRDEEDAFEHVFLFWKLNDFQPNKVLKEIIQADLGSGNYFLTSSVYFVSMDDTVLFHLYDDRGADLAAGKKETIQYIYQNLNEWVVDYDREKMERIFNSL